MARRSAERVILPILAVIVAALAHSGVFVPPPDPVQEVAAATLGATDQGSTADATVAARYAALFPADRSFRPAVRWSYEVDKWLGDSVRITQLIDAALNAGVVCLVYVLLRLLLPDPWIATFGAALYGVLPIHTEAVVSLAGRASLLSALAILSVWLLCLVNSAARERGRESPWVGFVATAVAFAGTFADVDVVTVLPLILVACCILRRRVPWLTLFGVVSSILAYMAVRQVMPGGFRASVSLLHNPLGAASTLWRVAMGLRLLGLYLWKSVVPAHLSADYSYDQLPVVSTQTSVALLWVVAVSALFIGSAWFFRRRAPVATLGIVVFVLTLALKAHFLFPAQSLFAERFAYTGSLGVVLAACGALHRPPDFSGGGLASGRRRAILSALGAAVVLYGSRAWFRSHAWSDPIAMGLRVVQDSPRSAWSQLKAAEACLWMYDKAREEDKASILQKAKAHLDEALSLVPDFGRAEELLGKILMLEGSYAAAADRLARATGLLAQQDPPEVEPALYRLRGECYWLLGKPEKAIEDLDPYIVLLAHGKSAPDAVAHNFRGLARATLGKLNEALEDFNAALAVRQDQPDVWNNRGFCRYKLGDLAGAIDDYKRGFDLCVERKQLYSRSGDSAYAFLRKIADVEDRREKELQSAGNVEGARRAAEQAARLRAEAARIEADASGTKAAAPQRGTK